MQLLSRILGAKKAADAHHAAVSATPAPKQEELPYRHIPTHALSDSMALGGNMPTADLHERIIAENRRHSQKPPSLRRTGSETFLEYRGEMARQRSARDLARLAAEQDGGFMSGDKAEGAKKEKAKVNLSLPMPPTSNPYAMPAALQSPKRGGRSPLGSKKGSPVPSMLSVRVESIAEETEDAMITTPEHMLDEKKGGDRGDADGYFPVQK